MTRRLVYSAGFWVFLAATALTIASIIEPRWISWDRKTTRGDPIHDSYGLHRRCSSLTGVCTEFPRFEDCTGDQRHFCSAWRSVGFLMSFSVVLELSCVIAFAVILLGGRQKREVGWKVLGWLLGLASVAQLISMAVAAFLYDHDDKFPTGWKLDVSWILCTVSWCILALDAAFIIISALILPSEGDYELIPDRPVQPPGA
ncbi:hypothetical protein EV356DRAFT_283857 [Viridothelium virens]|uniref:Uncharacterized protein n=1 Tax=Viridothelium virens TaxID=1048519 RepID=A0A6A6H227_VIRVR|nr:hypothetical protein EV356DRAFT_283857 [Viridothelium virens]